MLRFAHLKAKNPLRAAKQKPDTPPATNNEVMPELCSDSDDDEVALEPNTPPHKKLRYDKDKEFVPDDSDDDDDDENDGEAENSDNDSDVDDEDNSVIDTIKQVLVDSGLITNLEMLSKKENTADNQTAVMRVAKLLAWSHHQAKGSVLDPKHAMTWFVDLIENYSSLLQTYSLHLRVGCKFSPSTIQNHLLHFKKAFNWLTLFSPMMKCFRTLQLEMAAFMLVIFIYTLLLKTRLIFCSVDFGKHEEFLRKQAEGIPEHGEDT